MKTNSLAKNVSFDSKLTRGEFFDIVFEDMITDLQNQIEALTKELNVLKAKRYDEATLERLGIKVRYSVTPYAHQSSTDSVTIRLWIDKSEFDLEPSDNEIYVDARRSVELQDKIGELQTQRRELQDKSRSAKTKLLKAHLETTKEGRGILAQIDALKASMQKLLPASK